MYYCDAVLATEVLKMKQLTRAMGEGKVAPMCGCPLSAMEKYIDQLNTCGYSVAVCNQTKGDDGSVIREVHFIKEPTKDMIPKPYKEEWDEYMRNFSEDSLKEQSVLEKKAPKKEKNLAKRLLKEIEELDMDNMSPMDAFSFHRTLERNDINRKENVICD